MKKRRVTIAAAAICLLMTGCSGLSLNSPDILAPPRAQGNQAEIQELIRSRASGDYEMVYPAEGKYKSSVIFRDLNGDGSDEAIALYSCEKDIVRVLIADDRNGSYSLLTEYDVASPVIDRVEFADFGGESDAILLSYPGTETALRSLTLISADGSGSRSDMLNSCAAHLVGDFDGDGTQDLLTLAISDGKELPTARLFTGSGGSPEEQSSCEIASDAKEYIGLHFGKLSDDLIGAVVDAKCVDGGYSTQLICYDAAEGVIINPLYVGDEYQKTKRAAAITSRDIDGDEIIEIPLCNPMGYSQNEEISSVCDLIEWSRYDYTGLSLIGVQPAILCDRLGFMLNLSPERASIVTARYTDENAVTVYLWEYKRNTTERSTKLLTVKRYGKSSYGENAPREAVAAQSGAYIYTYIIENKDEYFGFTDDEVTNNFVLTEDPSMD